MKICGYRYVDFVDKETGVLTRGYSVYQRLDVESNGSGYYTEKHFIRDSVCENCGIDANALQKLIDTNGDLLIDKVGKRITSAIIL